MATARVLAAIPIEIGVVAIGASIAISISIGVAVLFERWKKRQTSLEPGSDAKSSDDTGIKDKSS
tara:strand:- start:65 stop:259 length:195 start_codon:yes stop_codon:yes gene_type:complete